MMKKRILALALCVLMAGSVLLMAGCKSDDGGETEPTTPSGDATYKVTVVDGAGNPYTENLLVTIYQNGEKVTMMPISFQGTVEKTLPRADYTVEVTSTDPEAKLYFDANEAKLSAEKTELELVVSNEIGEETVTISAPSTIENAGYLEFDAHPVKAGSTHVELTAEDRNFFLFTPEQEGIYEIFVSGNAATIGVYGGTTAYIVSNSIYEVVDGKITTTLYPSMIGQGETGSNVLVIGLDVQEASDCVLNVIRTDTAPWSITQEPWQVYTPKAEITPFTLEEGVTLEYFDLTSSEPVELVLNPETGCYHVGSVDGPRVFVQLAEVRFLVSMLGMVGEITYDADGNEVTDGVAPFRYAYDNGQDDFFKEDYTEAMQQFVTNRDKASGVYPMNEDLFYMLPMGIEYNGWLKEGTADYLFDEEEGFDPTNGWLFFCMYEVLEEDPTDDPGTDTPGTDTPGTDTPGTDTPGTDTPVTPPVEDNKGAPITIAGTLSFEAEVKANHLVYYELIRANDMILTINDANAYVIYNGVTYEAKNGVVTVPNLYSPNMYTPTNIAIGNKGTSDKTFNVSLSYPYGHSENPKKLEFKTLTVKTAKDDSDGVYFTWTATADGVLTIKLDSCTSAFGADVVVDRVRGSIPVQFVMDEEETGETVLTVEVKKGDKITMCVSANPDDNWSYPAATIKVTPSFE